MQERPAELSPWDFCAENGFPDYFYTFRGEVFQFFVCESICVSEDAVFFLSSGNGRRAFPPADICPQGPEPGEPFSDGRERGCTADGILFFVCVKRLGREVRLKNKPDGLFFNQDLRRSVANPENTNPVTGFVFLCRRRTGGSARAPQRKTLRHGGKNVTDRCKPSDLRL